MAGALIDTHVLLWMLDGTLPDPFDRIIAAAALLTGLPLVTADARIQQALGERAIW